MNYTNGYNFFLFFTIFISSEISLNLFHTKNITESIKISYTSSFSIYLPMKWFVNHSLCRLIWYIRITVRPNKNTHVKLVSLKIIFWHNIHFYLYLQPYIIHYLAFDVTYAKFANGLFLIELSPRPSCILKCLFEQLVSMASWNGNHIFENFIFHSFLMWFSFSVTLVSYYWLWF